MSSHLSSHAAPNIVPRPININAGYSASTALEIIAAIKTEVSTVPDSCTPDRITPITPNTPITRPKPVSTFCTKSYFLYLDNFELVISV